MPTIETFGAAMRFVRVTMSRQVVADDDWVSLPAIRVWGCCGIWASSTSVYRMVGLSPGPRPINRPKQEPTAQASVTSQPPAVVSVTS